MKNVERYFAIAGVFLLAGAAAAQPREIVSCAPPPPALASEFTSAAPLTFPTFCEIPANPTNIKSAQTYKSEVVDTRLAGAWLERQTGPETFSLTGTEAFDAAAVREAAPPPPMTPPGDADTAAFVAKSRAKATPPRRPR